MYFITSWLYKSISQSALADLSMVGSSELLKSANTGSPENLDSEGNTNTQDHGQMKQMIL